MGFTLMSVMVSQDSTAGAATTLDTLGIRLLQDEELREDPEAQKEVAVLFRRRAEELESKGCSRSRVMAQILLSVADVIERREFEEATRHLQIIGIPEEI